VEVSGKVFKDKRFWLAEIPVLDLMVQAETKKQIPEMLQDAVELLVGDSEFSAAAYIVGDKVFLSANDVKTLLALMLKRLRVKANNQCNFDRK